MIFPQIRQAIPRGEYLKNTKAQNSVEEIITGFRS
jgi:hypothetical protein